MRRPLCTLLGLLACSPKVIDSSSGPASTTDAATDSTTTADTAASTSTPTTTGGGPEDQFGFVCIELEVGESVAGDPFLGTAKIQATMFYEPCLIDYYVDKHPEMRADGPADQGGAVFAAWKDRLCSEPVADRIDCAVESFEQTLNIGGVTPLYNLTVTYTDLQPDQLNGRRLLWGPGPLPAFAECDDGQQPFVKLTALPDLVGLDEQGDVLWALQSFGATPRGLLGLTASECLQVPITD
jgi:hypothetical protein